jgi:hypothetical protein
MAVVTEHDTERVPGGRLLLMDTNSKEEQSGLQLTWQS